MIYNKQRKDWNEETYEVRNRGEKKKGKQILIKTQVMCKTLSALNSFFMSLKWNVQYFNFKPNGKNFHVAVWKTHPLAEKNCGGAP